MVFYGNGDLMILSGVIHDDLMVFYMVMVI